jgi:GT2 family glycosyltransferase
VAAPDDTLEKLSEELEDLRTILNQLRGTISLARSTQEFESAKSATLRDLDAANVGLLKLGHALRISRSSLRQLQLRLKQAEREAAENKAKRADATARLNERERQLEAVRKSAVWRALKPIRKLTAALRRSKPRKKAATDDILFELESPKEWTTERELLLIKGWCFSKTGGEIAGVRAKIGRKGRIGHYGLERTDIAQAYRGSELARFSGFTIEVPVPIGRSIIRLERIEQGGDWQPFFEHEVTGNRQATSNSEADHAVRPRTRSQSVAKLPPLTLGKALQLVTPRLQQHAEANRGTDVLVSVITPTFNTKPQWLAEAALSLLDQTCSAWEWCLVDDGSRSRETRKLLERLATITPRLRVKLAESSGISSATNAALDSAHGEFVCFVDHDDLLAPDALQLCLAKLNEGFDVVYSDEDKLDPASGQLVEPFFKPDWSPEYFRGVMYVGHLLCIRREIATRVRFDPQFDGVQDFEFMLRVSETGARIGHVPEVLYHWRRTPGSIAHKADAKPEIDALQQRAVNAHLERLKLPAKAGRANSPHRLRIVPGPRRTYPLISLIIPTKDAPQLLRRCLSSIAKLTSYPEVEVVLVDNQTTDPEALRLIEEFPVRKVPLADPFNFSRAINEGARAAVGEFVVFLNNDTEIVVADWLEQLLYYAEQADVGAVGSLLLYDNGTVQHAGVVLGMRGTADHVMRGFPAESDGYAGTLACAHEVSAVTAACMMMRKSVFEEIGGMNEHFFTEYQDVDLCLRLRERGLRIIYTPQAKLVHHESASRQKYYDMIDRMLLLDRWESAIDEGDPYYNQNLHLERGDYSPGVAR